MRPQVCTQHGSRLYGGLRLPPSSGARGQIGCTAVAVRGRRASHWRISQTLATHAKTLSSRYHVTCTLPVRAGKEPIRISDRDRAQFHHRNHTSARAHAHIVRAHTHTQYKRTHRRRSTRNNPQPSIQYQAEYPVLVPHRRKRTTRGKDPAIRGKHDKHQSLYICRFHTKTPSSSRYHVVCIQTMTARA